MSYKIIVSRYNENIEWLNNEMQNCIIYNKGNKLNIDNEIIIENVGRESETYLHYIITNYDNLPDIIVFTQAKIADHKGSDDVNYLINIKNEALYHSKSQNFLTHYHGKNVWDIQWDNDWNFSNGKYYLSDNYKNEPIKFIDWFKQNIHINYPDPIKIYSSAIFAVKKEVILKKSLQYYENLILQVNHDINPTEGHFFERSWFYVFN